MRVPDDPKDVQLRRLWLEIRSLRVSFDDAFASAQRTNPRLRKRALRDLTLRAESLLSIIWTRASAAHDADAIDAVGQLDDHIRTRLLLATWNPAEPRYVDDGPSG